MEPKPHGWAFRVTSLGLTIVAFPMLLIAGILSADIGVPSPFFAIVPMWASFITSILFFGTQAERKDGETNATTSDEKMKRKVNVIFVFDTICALAFFGVLLAIWILEPARLQWHGDWLMGETYGSACLLANMFIHGYFAYREWRKVLQPLGLFGARVHECPRCHYKAASRGEARDEESAGEEYGLLEVESDDDDGATLTPGTRASEEGPTKDEVRLCEEV